MAEIVGLLDRRADLGPEVAGYPLVGSDNDLVQCAESTGADGFVVAIGDNATRRAVTAQSAVAAPHLEAVRAVHPAAVVARKRSSGRAPTSARAPQWDWAPSSSTE